MNEFKELLKLWDASKEGATCDERAYDNLHANAGFLGKLRELAQSTAYVVPKCPKCKTDDVTVEFWEHRDGFVLVCGGGCRLTKGVCSTLAEAVRVFGKEE